jgi:hypothetical protein
LGKDINLQLQELFSNQKADGRAKMNWPRRNLPFV